MILVQVTGQRVRVRMAGISAEGRRVGIGCYASEDDAARVYNEIAVAWCGEFASLKDVPPKTKVLKRCQR